MSQVTSRALYRPMQEGDLPAARQLWQQAEGVELAEGDSEAELAAYLRRNPGMSHVAMEGTRLVGAVLAGHDGRRGLLYHLAVVPDRRGAGLGQALLAKALGALKDAGVVRVIILVARENEHGRTFWLRQGWEEIAAALPMGRDL